MANIQIIILDEEEFLKEDELLVDGWGDGYCGWGSGWGLGLGYHGEGETCKEG